MMSEPVNTIPGNSTPAGRRRRWRRLIKGLALFIMAAVLYCAGLVVIALSLLTPERLTPIVTHVAETSLRNCRVDISRVTIGLRKTYPFFNIEVDSVTITSTVVAQLPDSVRRQLPDYADTLFHIDRFSGGINVASLAAGRFEFSDLTIDGPGINAVIIDESTNNFNIFPVSETKEEKEPFDIAGLPTVKIKRFAITNPRPIRYFDRVTATEMEVGFQDIAIDGNAAPLYKLRFNGLIDSPVLMEYLSATDLRFGLNGDFTWDQKRPYALGVDNFSFMAGPVSGIISAKVDFTDGLEADALDLTLNPVEIDRIIKILPSDLNVPDDIVTDATVSAKIHLTEPFKAASSLLPHFTADIDIPDASLKWRGLNLDKIAMKVRITVPGDYLDDVRIDLNRFVARGKATDLSIEGSVRNLITDPMFEGRIEGHCNLTMLPKSVLNLIPGYIRGRIHANTHISGKASMFTLHTFQQLKIDGTIDLNDLYWVAPDTITMISAHRAVFDFGTQRQVTVDSLGHKQQLLSTKLTVDSAAIFHNVLDMHIRDFSIGLGAQNHRHRRGEKVIIPMGGAVRVGYFNLLSLTDSARVRISDATGTASIGTHGNDMSKPEFSATMTIGRMMAGDRATRFSLRNAATHVTAWREPQGRRAKQVSAIYDSLRTVHPHLTPDSLIADAMRIHALKHPRRKRSRLEETPDSSEVFEWYTDNSIKKILLGWRVTGSVKSKRARLFTPYFPVRNRISNLDLSFNNDSINLNALRYRTGRSDFNIYGKITNVRRALTSVNSRSPIRIRLNMTSDTIDVNQLAEATFAGAAYQSASDSLKQTISYGDTDNEEAMEQAVAASRVLDKGESKPLLIPRNIDAEIGLEADNILYSDLLLHNFTGTLLAYNGAVNIQDLNASSDVGAVNLSALYMGRTPGDLKFGFGLKVDRFNIHRFLRLVPAIDSLMPMLRNFGGIINADIAATADLTPQMDFRLPTLDAAVSLNGDSLVLLDPDTFKMLSKWLFFKDKKKNIIDHMAVQMLVRDNVMEMYPFIFNIDRYRLGIQGTNDFNLNFKYHIAVLKSPIPFKFGINIEGTPDKYKIRLGGAKFDDKTPRNVTLVDNTRVNLVKEIESVFRRNIDDARFARIRKEINAGAGTALPAADTLSHSDSLMFIREGLIEAPEPASEQAQQQKKKKKDKRKK
ncbi:MAG: AsmA-like C-terminal region-containing protein [Bacteroidales bacterium]|nr:AsmA-like C-terminal region-containing protein [Bacteroidales bacterium]